MSNQPSDPMCVGDLRRFISDLPAETTVMFDALPVVDGIHYADKKLLELLQFEISVPPIYGGVGERVIPPVIEGKPKEGTWPHYL